MSRTYLSWRSVSRALGVTLALLVPAAWGDEPGRDGTSAPPAGAEETGNQTDAHLRRALRQLEADEFAQRREARRELLAAGRPAVELIVTAARAARGHLARECVQLLEEFSRSPDPALLGAGLAGLGQLAGCDNPEVAQLAITALRTPPQLPEQTLPLRGNRIVAPPPAPPLPGPPFDAQGKREVDVDIDGRQVHIEELRTGRITVRITEKVEGQPRVTEHIAENLTDLLRKNQEAFRLYMTQLLGRRMVNGPIQVGGNGAGQRFHLQISTTNGQRTIRAEGDGRVTQLEDRDGRDIRMTITQTIDGREQTRTVSAADLAELRNRDAAAADEYERLTGQRPFGHPQEVRRRNP